VPAVELTKRDGVAAPFELRYDAAAAAIDWQDLVGATVRHEDLRPASGFALDEETRREGDDTPEQIAVDQAERERVGGTVRETANRDALRINRNLLEHTLERVIEKRDITTEALDLSMAGDDIEQAVLFAEHGIPGASA
jgi:hypothetical protein